jgi:general secretion pathway protein K
MMMQRPYRQGEAGLALVAVLGIIVLLSLLAASVLDITRRHGQLIQRSIEASQAQETADSAIRLVLRDLIVQVRSDGAGWPASPRSVDVFGRPIAITVQFEAGRVDVNFADRDTIFAVLAANGVPEAAASALASRVLDWRDPDDAAGPEGAERRDYDRAGRVVGPRNAPFESVSELSLVLGFNDVPATLLGAFTVHSHLRRVRQSDAVPPVERALRWADQRELAGRRWLTRENASEAYRASGRPLAGETLRISACLKVAPRACREGIVRLTGSAISPLQILSWQSTYDP